MFSTFIIHIDIYIKLYPFWTYYAYILLKWRAEYAEIEKNYRYVGAMMERVFGITLMLEDKKIELLNIKNNTGNRQSSYNNTMPYHNNFIKKEDVENLIKKNKSNRL